MSIETKDNKFASVFSYFARILIASNRLFTGINCISVWNFVCIGSLFVMHLGFLHFKTPMNVSGNSNSIFSVTSYPLMMFIFALGAKNAILLTSS